MIPEELKEVLWSDPERMGGTVCFRGTRVPVEALLDAVAYGGGLQEFLDGWPQIQVDAARAVLQWQRRQVEQAFELSA